jgi:hypothetical protein
MYETWRWICLDCGHKTETSALPLDTIRCECKGGLGRWVAWNPNETELGIGDCEITDQR